MCPVFRRTMLLRVFFSIIVFAQVVGLSEKSDSFNDPYSSSVNSTDTIRHHKRYPVAKFDFDRVATPFVITVWIFIACIAKIAFHVSPKLSKYCPESCMLLLVGVSIGLVLYHSNMMFFNEPLTPTVFFMFMLPPIVFDAGYFMPNRLFFDNLMSILTFAFVGTVWNAISIGVSLWAVGLTGIFKDYYIPMLDMLLFSSIVSAVDPVAVLAVFEEIHVNEVLYIIVFGESLLNDAVTVVLYHIFEEFAEAGVANIVYQDYLSAVASFFVVSCGGTLIGIVIGFCAAFLSRFTSPVAVIEPMIPFITGYVAYLSAEMFHLSGILSLVFCGITMKNYVRENISNKSHTTVKYVTKMLATASETIIFVVLGVSTVNDKHEWNTFFVIFAILFCSVYRVIGVIGLTACLNRYRLHQLNGVEQFIMSYGGLRGAVAFSLALIIDEKVIRTKDMMVTTIIAVVYFTVFVQGMTIKFFVRILKVPIKSEKQVTMNERLHNTLLDHLMGGIEEVADQILGNYKIRDRFKHFNNKYLRRILTNNSKVNEPRIFQTQSKLNMRDALNNANDGSKLTVDQSMSLSTVIRNYTAANLNTLGPDQRSHTPNHSPLMNLDLGEMAYIPNRKDLADFEIHHILTDSMFKAPKKTRRYSHSTFDESEKKHPPFNHQMRMKIRRMVSERNKRMKVRTKFLMVNGDAQRDGQEEKETVRTIYRPTSSMYPRVTLSSLSYVDQDSNSDDDGAIFMNTERRSKSLDDTECVQHECTATETILPWKRGLEEHDLANPQVEFPTMIDNRDYYSGYLSPTPTFLEFLNDSRFHTATIHPSIDEALEDDCFKPESQSPGPSKLRSPLERPKSSTVSKRRRAAKVLSAEALLPHHDDQIDESLVQEVMHRAAPFRRPLSSEDKRRLFRSKSPDRFSLTSLPSGESSKSESGLVHIEGPDVVLNIEDDHDVAETKI